MEISEPTRQLIGPEYLNFMKKLEDAGEVTLPGAIVSRADIFDGAVREERVTDPLISRAFNQAGINVDTFSPLVLKALEEGGATPKEAITSLDISIKEFARNNTPFTVVQETNSGGKGLIVHGDFDSIDDLNAFPMSTIPDYANNLPGVPQDYERLFLVHEVEHVPQAVTMSRTAKEYHADLEASEDYYKAYKEGGLVTDAEVPYAFRSMRAITTVMRESGESSEYALNGIAPLPGENDIVGNDIEGATKNVNLAVDKLYEKIGASVSNETDPKARMEVGEEATWDQPELLYEEARKMLARGEFDDNPEGKQLMENFVDGAQRYQSDYFGVEPADIPTARPEIVEQLDKQYMPSLPIFDFNPGLDK